MTLPAQLNDREYDKFKDVSGRGTVVKVETEGASSDIPNTNYLTGAVTVSTSAIEAKVGVSSLTERKMLLINNTSNATVFYGPSGVTTTTGAPLAKGALLVMPFGPDNHVYLIRASGSGDVIVQEAS
jgi:hypothetical protein